MVERRKSVPTRVATKLWVKAGGRCQYEGCNELLYRDSLTQLEMNRSYISHIVSAKPNWARGNEQRSKKLEQSWENLMLLCDTCHRRIDREDAAAHSEERLLKMKADHEARIELLTDIKPDKKSHIVIYTAKVCSQEISVSYEQAAYAMIPERFPTTHYPLRLGIANSIENDFSKNYWSLQLQQLEDAFRYSIEPLLAKDPVQDFSVFAFAPQPLLIRLGTLLSDKYPGYAYQLHRKEHPWKWEEECETKSFTLIKPANITDTPALVISLSGSILHKDIHAELGTGCSIWEMTIDHPFNGFLRSKDLLKVFKLFATQVVSKIRQRHGCQPLHIFPAMPVSAAVEFGKLRMSKSDMPWVIYDYNNRIASFSKSITIM